MKINNFAMNNVQI